MEPCDNQRLSISVIIPTYNRAAFIVTAVESALNQTQPANEILVVDDGSTDGTDHILRKFGPPVTVIRQTNRGRSAARNAGLRATTGDAVIFLDSDDVLMPHVIESCAQILNEHPEVGVVYTDALLVDAERNPLSLYSKALPGCRPSGMVLGELARRNFLTISSMVRRSFLREIEFDESMECAEDYDFWRRLAALCEFQYVDEPLMCYRFHEAMTVSNRMSETLAAEAEVQRRIMDMPEFKNLSRREQSRAFCIHGIKHAVLGTTSMARGFFRRSIRTSPTNASPYALLLLSLLGTRALQFAILKRRKLAGNRLGTRTGPDALLQTNYSSRRTKFKDGGMNTAGKIGIKLPVGES
jgi:glycosyltransferase involved in cell wall biosynthesis